MRRFFNSVIGALTLSYPLAVYFGIHYLKPCKIALILALLLLGRLLNGMAAATAVWSGFAFWILYKGSISYILIGMLMAVENWVRIRMHGFAC